MEYEIKDARSIDNALTCGEIQKIKIRLYKQSEHENFLDSKKITFKIDHTKLKTPVKVVHIPI